MNTIIRKSESEKVVPDDPSQDINDEVTFRLELNNFQLMEKLREHLLIGFGNPLLDIAATVANELLKKYNLKKDDAILARHEHKHLCKYLHEKYNAEFIAGGSVQNTLRVCQWILQKPRVATFFGCVGKDNYATILEKKAIEDGLNVCYQYTDEAPTGTCAVLITGTHRSLCAHLAAANHFTLEHLQKPENRQLWESAEYFYISGFFLTVSPPSIMEVARHSHKHNGAFMMNLSAPFVSQHFKEALMVAMPYVDLLFGNKDEVETFARELSWHTENLEEVGQKIVALHKADGERKRIVVITQGSQPVLLFHGNSIKDFPVQKLTPEQIVDTNGAGDAFVGGFLAQYITKKPLDVCVHCGVWAAAQIIQRSGCTFEGKPSFQV
uniref:Adenosine kinase n=1 Tax=Glossina brevipalpis TaxID=37001 RepID=A0A1A9WIL5_9MUSC